MKLYPTWYKVPAIRERLRTHRFVVFLDADAIFVNPELPLEWLLNYWNVTNATALIVAREPPNASENLDLFGQPNVNAGFMIFQQHELTDQIFDAWITCPQSAQYPACEPFSFQFPHEQGALSSFVRYDFGPWINEISCDEANGFPSATIAPFCNGTLVRHRWYAKAKIHGDMVEQLARVVFRRLHRLYLQNEADLATEDTVGPLEWEPTG